MRKVDGAHSIHYKNKIYYPINKDGEVIYFKGNNEALVIESFSGKLYVNIGDTLYGLAQIEIHDKHYDATDFSQSTRKKVRPFIPAMCHPWKQSSYLNYLRSMEHRKQEFMSKNF